MVKIDGVANEALAVVNDKDLSIAIGKDGSNVKIATYITGFRIDVKSESQFSEEMSSPEARKRLEELFSVNPQKEESEEHGTPLSDLPGLTRRIQKILKDSGIQYLEDLVEMEESDLINLEGMGKATAQKILETISEYVEFEETEETGENEEIQESNEHSAENTVDTAEKPTDHEN